MQDQTDNFRESKKIVGHIRGAINKKNSLIDDIVQIGWVGHGLKPHFLKERNMDNYKGRVGQKSICPYFKN